MEEVTWDNLKEGMYIRHRESGEVFQVKSNSAGYGIIINGEYNSFLLYNYMVAFPPSSEWFE